MLAGPSPEVLIGPIAAATERIRVGSGGVMLPHYSPYKVAEIFAILAGLFPGRIDLGLGRASGTDPLTTFALQRDRRQASPTTSPSSSPSCSAYLDGTIPDDHPFHRLRCRPRSARTRGCSARPRSARSGPTSSTSTTPSRTSSTRGRRAGPRQRAAAVAVWALAADTEEEAQHLAASCRMTLRELRRGNLIPVPPPEKALEYLREPRPHQSGGRRAVIGTPEQVRAGLEEVADAYGADEVIVVTITYDHAARRRSYELIAEACGLEPAETRAGHRSGDPRADEGGG